MISFSFSLTKDTIPKDSTFHAMLKDWDYDKKKIIEKNNKIALKIFKNKPRERSEIK